MTGTVKGRNDAWKDLQFASTRAQRDGCGEGCVKESRR